LPAREIRLPLLRAPIRSAALQTAFCAERFEGLGQLKKAGVDVRDPASSANYDLFEQAMNLRKPIFCVYGGYPRVLCPIILGHSQKQEKALTFQVGGQSRSGLPRGGQWRCLWLSKVGNAQLRDGPWVVGSSHTQPQGCVEIVDLDVNPASPYHPKRSVRPAGRRPARRKP
jgi:hypothetical protein